MMNAIMSQDSDKRVFGDKILKNVGKHLQAQKQQQKAELQGMT